MKAERTDSASTNPRETSKAEKLSADDRRDEESLRDAVEVTINDFLWSDEPGLPVSRCGEQCALCLHVFPMYAALPWPRY